MTNEQKRAYDKQTAENRRRIENARKLAKLIPQLTAKFAGLDSRATR